MLHYLGYLGNLEKRSTFLSLSSYYFSFSKPVMILLISSRANGGGFWVGRGLYNCWAHLAQFVELSGSPLND